MSERDYRKETLKSFKPYIVGKPIEEVKRELGLTGRIAKLASNENPLGVSPKALEAIRQHAADVNLYPDDNHFYLKQSIAAKQGLRVEELYIASGSVEIIEVIGNTFLQAGDEVIASAGSFAMYRLAAMKAGATFVETPLKDTYHVDLDAMAAAITDKTKVIFFANPNNPTGTWATAAQFDAFMDKVPQDVLVVYDAAYFEYITDNDLPDPKKYFNQGRDFMVLHTFSKIYGMAGLRIGYGYGPKHIIAHLNLGRIPFNASVLAQVAAIAALDDDEFVNKTREFTRSELDYITAELADSPVTVVPSQTNFILIDTGKEGAWLFTELQKRGVIVRPMAGYGFPNAVRVNVGLHEDNERFVAAFKELL